MSDLRIAELSRKYSLSNKQDELEMIIKRELEYINRTAPEIVNSLLNGYSFPIQCIGYFNGNYEKITDLLIDIYKSFYPKGIFVENLK